MKKSILALTLAAVMIMAVLGGCGGQTDTFVIGASPVPHAEILKAAEADLLAAGIKLEIKEFTDYIMPNTALESGDIDANYFQHLPYLEDFNKENNTHIVSVLAVHFEPYGLYPGKLKTLDELTDGSTIAVPSDPTNEARALQLLQANGIIKLKDGVGLAAMPKDIIENPKNVEIKELEAAMIPRAREDVDFVILNGNYALDAGLNVDKDALIKEDKTSEGAGRFANVLCVKEGNENSETVKKVKEILTSEKMKKFIEEKYQGAVVPVF